MMEALFFLVVGIFAAICSRRIRLMERQVDLIREQLDKMALMKPSLSQPLKPAPMPTYVGDPPGSIIHRHTDIRS